MGFLPIAVAIFGFTLLWAVVNYNSLLTRLEQIRKMEETSGALENQRKSMVEKLKTLLSHFSILDPDIVQQLYQLPTASSLKTKELTATVKTYLLHHRGEAQHPEIDHQLSQLEDIDFHLYHTQRKMQQSILVYNKLVTRMPSRIVATISGFKPVS